MKKIMIKSALLTVGAVVGFAVIVYVFISFAFPGTVAGWCEQTGNYNLAVKYSWLYYKYTGKISQLARCVEDSVMSGKDSYILNYGVKLIDDEGFSDYCKERDEALGQIGTNISISYRQYVYGAVAAAQYREGDCEKAIGFAIEALCPEYERSDFTFNQLFEYVIDDFPVTNAFGTLAMSVIDRSDAQSGEKILLVLENVNVTEAEQLKYLETICSALENL